MALSNALLFLSFFFAFPYLQHAFFHTTIFSRFGESSDVCFACFCATMALLLIVAGAFGKKVVRLLEHPGFTPLLVALSVIPMVGLPLAAGGSPGFVQLLLSCLYGISFTASFISLIGLAVRLSRSNGIVTCIALIASASAASLIVTVLPSAVYTAFAFASLPLCCASQLALSRSLPEFSRRAGEPPSLGTRRASSFAFVMYFAVAAIGAFLYLVETSSELLADTPGSIALTLLFPIALAIGCFASKARNFDVEKLALLIEGCSFALIFFEILLMGFFQTEAGLSDFATGVLQSLPRALGVFLLCVVLLPSVQTGSNYVSVACIYLLTLDCIPYIIRYLLLPSLTSLFQINVSAWFQGVLFVICLVLVGAMILLGIREISVMASMSKEASPYDHDEDRRSACKAISASAQLTDREAEVLFLVSSGHTAKKIADLLGVSIGTVNTHVKRLYSKLGIHSRQEAIDLVEGYKK